MLFNYTHIKMAEISQISPNMSAFGEVCDRLGKTFLASHVRYSQIVEGIKLIKINKN